MMQAFLLLKKGLDVEGEKPDYVLTLGQKQGKMKLPLMIFHDKIPVERLDDTTSQLSGYAKKILEDNYEINNQTFEFENIFVVLIFPMNLEFIFIKFKRPTKNSTIADFVQYTGQCPLLQKGTYSLDMIKFLELFSLILNCTFQQLRSLNLVDEKKLKKSWDELL